MRRRHARVALHQRLAAHARLLAGALAERRPQLRLWDAGINDTLPTLDYSDYMHTDAGMRAWIEAIQLHGVVLLRGVPAQPGQLLDVARRIGPVRPSNFGEYYDVVSMPNPNASAYTSMGLELHTDLANWNSPPDVQLLFCIRSSVRGGESLFADGFKVATDLRARDPEAFRLLSSHPMDFRFHDDACDIRASAPTIVLDGEGRITRVRFNNWLRAPMSLPEPLIEPMYAALGTFWKMLRDPGYHLNLRLDPVPHRLQQQSCAARARQLRPDDRRAAPAGLLPEPGGPAEHVAAAGSSTSLMRQHGRGPGGA